MYELTKEEIEFLQWHSKMRASGRTFTYDEKFKRLFSPKESHIDLEFKIMKADRYYSELKGSMK